MAPPIDNRRGILAMLAAVLAFVTSDSLMRLAAADLPTGQIIVLRGVVATALVAATAASLGALRDIGAFRQPLVILRGAIEGVVALLFIAALPGLPLADITAILLASSLMSTAIAATLGMEKVGVRRWAALIVGFGGVVIVLRPGLAGLTPPALLVCACTILIAIRDIVTRRIQASAPSLAIALASTVIVTLAGGLLGLVEPDWRWPTQSEAAVLLGAAGAVGVGNVMVIAAFRRSDVAVVSPFRYSSIVIAAAAGYLIWREVPDRWTLLGAAMIVGSGLYTIWREQVRAREAAAARTRP
jgi:drug/metabolite transporter (DMT)-like permease